MKSFKTKGAFLGTFVLLLSIGLFSCADTDNSTVMGQQEEEKNNESTLFTSGDMSYNDKTKTLKTKEIEINITGTEEKEDIDGKESFFVFAEITNNSQEKIIPEIVWNTYLRFSETVEGFDSLYQNVLPKEDLDGSEYKTAIDKMSQELAPEETALIGCFYNISDKNKVYLSVMDEQMAILYQGIFPINEKAQKEP